MPPPSSKTRGNGLDKRSADRNGGKLRSPMTESDHDGRWVRCATRLPWLGRSGDGAFRTSTEPPKDKRVAAPTCYPSRCTVGPELTRTLDLRIKSQGTRLWRRKLKIFIAFSATNRTRRTTQRDSEPGGRCSALPSVIAPSPAGGAGPWAHFQPNTEPAFQGEPLVPEPSPVAVKVVQEPSLCLLIPRVVFEPRRGARFRSEASA